MRIKYARKRLFFVMYRSPQARNQGGEASPRKMFAPPGKMCWTYFETIGHSLKNLSPLRKLLAHPDVPS